MTACSLCQPELGPVIAQGEHWKVVLNHNQNLLGKLMLVLRRHAEQVIDLRPDEWAELSSEVQDATRGLSALLKPDHFNYAFLQNQDRHVHLHIIPRYAGPRSFAAHTFEDPDYPAHYAVPSPVRRLSDEQLERLATELRRVYEQVRRAGGDVATGQP